LALLGLVGFAACASVPRAADPLRQLESELGAAGLPAELVAPMRLTPEMRDWADQLQMREGPEEMRLRMLLERILDRPGPEFVYRSGSTRGAAAAWASGEANCLAFSHLFVAMARAIGIDAYYLRVRDLTSFDREGDLIITSDHVTAAWGPAPTRVVLDFSARPVREYREVEPIPDRTALALHYSNLGAEKIREGEPVTARALLETAVHVDPTLADSWVNLGVARRRDGDARGAEAAYRRALEIDSESLSAYHNLSSLLAVAGRGREAASLAGLAERAGARNPWSYLALGDLALREGQLVDAGRLLQRAYRLDPGNVEILAALGQWAVAAGEARRAQRLLRRAERIDPANPRVEALARRLDDPRSPG